ncbi:hypothetical protein [Streptomyces sp. NPDC013187]|uniref:hypothetical protein n=1 Tax=Streptomyces sp. NPDC013187 TaxID=3364865 RepID=UPI00368C5534
MQREHTGSGLRLGAVLDRTSAYTRYAVTYEANGLTISGIMNIPEGGGSLPGAGAGTRLHRPGQRREPAHNTLVVTPGLFDAAVAYAPVSARPEENIEHFQRPDGDPLVAEIEEEHGTPEENPGFWRGVSPRSPTPTARPNPC